MIYLLKGSSYVACALWDRAKLGDKVDWPEYLAYRVWRIADWSAERLYQRKFA